MYPLSTSVKRKNRLGENYSDYHGEPSSPVRNKNKNKNISRARILQGHVMPKMITITAFELFRNNLRKLRADIPGRSQYSYRTNALG